jgi:ADP-ribose pyrophosphatase
VTQHPFRKIQGRIVFENPWFRLQEHEVVVEATGRRFRYAYMSTVPSVMVVALTEAGKIVLIRQYRYPQRAFAYELPGGGTDGEPPRLAARKELAEETGYVASRWRKAGEFAVYCGLSDETCHAYFARGLRPGVQKLEETEHATVHEVSYARLLRMIERGRFRDGMGLAALALARPLIEKELGLPSRTNKRR